MLSQAKKRGGSVNTRAPVSLLVIELKHQELEGHPRNAHKGAPSSAVQATGARIEFPSCL